MRAVVPADRTDEWPPRFETLVDRRLLEAVATAAPSRGDFEHVEQIAWWGAAVSWTTAPQPDAFPSAAAFNVAVAAFDSVHDIGGETAARMAAALAPPRLRLMIHGSDTASTDETTDPVVGLFELALVDFGRRWRHDPEHLERGYETLLDMYVAETSTQADPMPAKTLPSVFLAMIATNDADILDVHCRLGEFLAAWDDWMDLDEDARERQPNWYLGGGRRLSTARHFAAVAGRMTQRGRQSIADELVRLAVGVVAEAENLDLICQTRTLALLRAVVT